MIDTIFEELKRFGAVRSGADFSRNWLGMEDSYWRGLRAKRREPSLKAIARCASKLNVVADNLQVSAAPSIEGAQLRLRDLAAGCVADILRAGN